MYNSPEGYLNLYLRLLKCFEDKTPAFELVRLIDKFFKDRNITKIVLRKNVTFGNSYDLPLLLKIKKKALILGEYPLGTHKSGKDYNLKYRINSAIDYFKREFNIITFNTQNEDYLEYLKNRNTIPISFVCSFCGVSVEITQNSEQIPKKIYCPYCSKENDLKSKQK